MKNAKDTYGIKNINFFRVGKDDKSWPKLKEQRLDREFDDSVLRSLDDAITSFIAPRLRRFRENHWGYPGGLKSDEAWCEILDKMLYWVENYNRLHPIDDNVDMDKYKEENIYFSCGLKVCGIKNFYI